jgi:hypothetical protein
MLESFGKAATDELLSSVISFKEKDMLLCPALERFLKRGVSLVPQDATRAEKVVIEATVTCHHLGWETIDCTIKSWNIFQCWKGRTFEDSARLGTDRETCHDFRPTQ